MEQSIPHVLEKPTHQNNPFLEFPHWLKFPRVNSERKEPIFEYPITIWGSILHLCAWSQFDVLSLSSLFPPKHHIDQTKCLKLMTSKPANTKTPKRKNYMSSLKLCSLCYCLHLSAIPLAAGYGALKSQCPPSTTVRPPSEECILQCMCHAQPTRKHVWHWPMQDCIVRSLSMQRVSQTPPLGEETKAKGYGRGESLKALNLA